LELVLYAGFELMELCSCVKCLLSHFGKFSFQFQLLSSEIIYNGLQLIVLIVTISAMGKGIHHMLKFFDSEIKICNHIIFALKLAFFLFEVLYLNFFSLDFAFKIRNLFVLLLGDSFDDIFFVFLKNIFDLGEVGFDDVSHSAEILEQGRNFLLQGCTEDSRDFRLHRPDHALDFFLIVGVLRYEGALDFHNSLNDDLELIDFGFLLIWKDVAVFKDLSDYLVEL